MKKAKDFEDDGRQVADMSGTYDSGMSGFISFKRFKKLKKEQKKEGPKLPEPEPLTKRETKKLMFNAMLAGLLVGVVFIAGALLFILFALNIWLK